MTKEDIKELLVSNSREWIKEIGQDVAVVYVDDFIDELLNKFYQTKSGIAFNSVSDQEPPTGVELLAKSPNGTVHICGWRPAYKIFTCQDKSESSFDWKWALL